MWGLIHSCILLFISWSNRALHCYTNFKIFIPHIRFPYFCIVKHLRRRVFLSRKLFLFILLSFIGLWLNTPLITPNIGWLSDFPNIFRPQVGTVLVKCRIKINVNMKKFSTQHWFFFWEFLQFHKITWVMPCLIQKEFKIDFIV